MVGWQQLYPLVVVKSTSQFGYRFGRIQKRLSCNRPEGADKDWLNSIKLSGEKRETGLNFIRSRIAVIGWSTLNDVANVNLASGQIYGPNDFRQQLPGRPHKRLGLSIFIKPRSLAHKHQFCCWTAGAENNVVAMLFQPATLAIAQIRANNCEGFTVLLRRHTPGGQFCKTVGMTVKSTKSAPGETLKRLA